MTREEAIELLEDIIGFVEDNHGRNYDGAFRMAIESLQRVVTTDFYVDGAKYSTVCSYGERKE